MAQIGPTTNGVFIISVTPFTDHGEIDWASVDSPVEFSVRQGVSGVTILGMMGEAHKLAETESVAFAKYFIERVAGRVPVVVGVSNAGVDSLVHLSKSGMDVGAGGVLPGLGKVEAIKRQDNLWIVVTAHGLIYSAP